MNRVLAQARIELIQITRDRTALILILALPLVLLIVIGSAITLKVSHLPIVIQDFDGSGTSREFADAFRASNSLYVVSWPTDRGLEDAFLLNKARAALVIPSHFERDILRRGGAPVQLLADGSDSNTAALVAGYVTSIVSAYNQSHGRAQRAAPVRAETRLWYNPGLDSQKVLRTWRVRAQSVAVRPAPRGVGDGQRDRDENDPTGLCVKHFCP